jgi:hypothetical protein
MVRLIGSGSRAGGHLIAFIRFQRGDREPLAICSCGLTIRANGDAELQVAWGVHRKAGVRDDPQDMERVKVAGGRGFALVPAGSGAPPDLGGGAGPAERQYAPDPPLDVHRMVRGGIGGRPL